MGQKVHPTGFRLGITKPWHSNWFAKRNYADLLHEDFMIRRYIKERLYHAGISKVEIERAANRSKINIHTARPGIIIGKRGLLLLQSLMQALYIDVGLFQFVDQAADLLG